MKLESGNRAVGAKIKLRTGNPKIYLFSQASRRLWLPLRYLFGECHDVYLYRCKVKVKVKQSHYRPEQAQRVPGS